MRKIIFAPYVVAGILFSLAFVNAGTTSATEGMEIQGNVKMLSEVPEGIELQSDEQEIIDPYPLTAFEYCTDETNTISVSNMPGNAMAMASTATPGLEESACTVTGSEVSPTYASWVSPLDGLYEFKGCPCIGIIGVK